jgi:SynChlorMet cassette radical SAM/SPASM protein ScmE
MAETDLKEEAAKLQVMRAPRTVDIDITARCNLRCRYCYFFNNPAVRYADLPAGEWLRFFEELGSIGVMEVTLAGGEPFIREDLRLLLDGIVRNRMRFVILSNGGLIEDDIAAFIKGTGRCNYVQISVDGSSPATHDICRGKGSFEGAVRGIRTLQRQGVPVTVRMTIHRHNVCDLEATAHLLLEELGLSGFGTNSAGYLGTCCVNANSLMLTTEDRQIAMATLLRLAEKYDGRISANAGPLAEGKMWARMEEARAKGEPAFPNGGRLTGCGCPMEKIAVRVDGAIIPCTMLAHMELGWINRDSLAEVWQKSSVLNDLRRRSRLLLKDFEFCSGCPYIDYCTGNCPALAYALVGQVDHPSPDACLRRFLGDGGTIPREKPNSGDKKVGSENPGVSR